MFLNKGYDLGSRMQKSIGGEISIEGPAKEVLRGTCLVLLSEAVYNFQFLSLCSAAPTDGSGQG